MNKQIMALGVLSSILFFPANAAAFYVGASFGESKTDVDFDGTKTSTDRDTALSLSVGMTLPIPLIPIRGEIEYMQLNSSLPTGDVSTNGVAANAYVGLPLFPIIKPYVGMGLAYLQQEIGDAEKSDWLLTPQYMLGLDISLPLIPIAGGIEYRYIDADFTRDSTKYNSGISSILIKARFEF